MKLAPEKCSFFTRKVKYVGHVVSEAGVEVDPAKTEKVVNCPKPTNPEDVKRFLDLLVTTDDLSGSSAISANHSMI